MSNYTVDAGWSFVCAVRNCACVVLCVFYWIIDVVMSWDESSNSSTKKIVFLEGRLEPV